MLLMHLARPHILPRDALVGSEVEHAAATPARSPSSSAILRSGPGPISEGVLLVLLSC